MHVCANDVILWYLGSGCENEGTCTVFMTCQCLSGWTGIRCEIGKDIVITHSKTEAIL